MSVDDRVTETDNDIKTMKSPQGAVFCFAWFFFPQTEWFKKKETRMEKTASTILE